MAHSKIPDKMDHNLLKKSSINISVRLRKLSVRVKLKINDLSK